MTGPDADLATRTARTARSNALSILVIAGLATLWSAFQGDLPFVGFGAALCVAAAAELAGSKRLVADPAGAAPLLIGGELAVLVLIAGYSLWRLVGFDYDAELAALPADARELLVGMAGDEELLRQALTLTNRLVYGCLLLVTLLYQGGMARFYRRRTAALGVA